MKKIYIIIFSMIVICFATLPIFAKGKSYGYSKSSFGRVHHVKSHYRKNIYVSSHLSGNPRSGVHCRKNVCY